MVLQDKTTILNFEYYFNLFQPEYVVFEVTEYAVNRNYFDSARLENFCLNPTLAAAERARRTRRNCR